MSRLATLPVSLPPTSLPEGIDVETLSKQFQTTLEKLIPPSNFLSDAVWWDNFALTGSLRTFYRADAASTAWNETTTALKDHSFSYLPQFTREWRLPDGSCWLEIYFEFETSPQPQLLCTVGLSIVHVAPDTSSNSGSWKIWVIKSVLDQLKNAPHVDILQLEEVRNMTGVNPASAPEMQSVDCVIVGGGQAGLNTAGRCEALGITYLGLPIWDYLCDHRSEQAHRGQLVLEI